MAAAHCTISCIYRASASVDENVISVTNPNPGMNISKIADFLELSLSFLFIMNKPDWFELTRSL